MERTLPNATELQACQGGMLRYQYYHVRDRQSLSLAVFNLSLAVRHILFAVGIVGADQFFYTADH